MLNYRPVGRRRIGRPSKRLLDEAKTGLSRSNSWRMIMMMMMMMIVMMHYILYLQFVCLFSARQPPLGRGLLIHEVSRSQTTTQHSRYGSSGRVIISSQSPLPDNTQHSQQTDIHAFGDIWTHNLSRRAGADPRLRLRGHGDQHLQFEQQ
jgi:hypothetical protein